MLDVIHLGLKVNTLPNKNNYLSFFHFSTSLIIQSW
jgi:hypothetical protein